MTTNFALSLSYAGIDLLQRVDDGWRRVGTASLLSADLAAELARLRDKGQALASDGLQTKIVIPSEQIKYLTIDSTQTTLGDIQGVLEGATPYRPDELAIDFERAGGRTHIAAVARDTLKEAEDFAKAHGFNPICFVAVPEPLTFRQEIFFGPTSVATSILGAGVSVDRDTVPVLLVGTRIKSQVILADETLARQTPDQVTTDDHGAVEQAATLALPYLDPVIGEYHARPVQTEVPLIAVPMAGSPRPVVLGGVIDAPVPARQQRAYVVPGAIAAGIAAMSVFLWAQYSNVAPASAVLDIAAADISPGPATSVVDIALPSPDISLDTAAVPTAETQVAPPTIGHVLSPDEAAAAYAATGVWQRAPRLVDHPPAISNDTTVFPVALTAPDRLARPDLPGVRALSTDLSFVPLPNPPAADVVFDLDDDGFVRATDDGALTPDGAVVYAGLPDLPFRARPTGADDASVDAAADQNAPALVAATDGITIIPGPPPVVPPVRPAVADPVSDDADTAEVAPDTASDTTPGGVALTGLDTNAEDDTAAPTATASLTPPPGAIRPRLRPALPQVASTDDEVTALLGGIAFAEPDPLAGASELAVATSLRPALRPGNIDQLVAAVRSSQQSAPAPEPAPVVVAAPVATPQPAAPAPVAAPPPPPPAQVAAPVAPQNYAPVPGGVARAATQENVIRLRDVNLIGVYGQANARRALVRLGNGQYIRVQVGSELDGGQVTAIGENALNYVRRGTTYALQIPSG